MQYTVRQTIIITFTLSRTSFFSEEPDASLRGLTASRLLRSPPFSRDSRSRSPLTGDRPYTNTMQNFLKTL